MPQADLDLFLADAFGVTSNTFTAEQLFDARASTIGLEDMRADGGVPEVGRAGITLKRLTAPRDARIPSA